MPAIIDDDTLTKEIKELLKDVDSKTTSRKIRSKLEEKLGVDLSSRSKQIDAIIMADIEDKVSSEEEVSEEEAEKDSDSEEEVKKKKAKAAPKKRKSGGGGDDGDDGDWGSNKPKKARGRGRGKKSAFTRSFKLSEELAEVVGSDVMPRHEVVKKLWQVIKERNLQDPKNKQFAICDDQLLKVFGVKKFRTFGMMKHLKEHFLEAA